MIGGFTLGGNTANARVAVRGIGSSLTSSGVSNVLADPTLELHNANGTIMISNDNWTDDPHFGGTADRQRSGRKERRCRA
jgi:hypothetical protein